MNNNNKLKKNNQLQSQCKSVKKKMKNQINHLRVEKLNLNSMIFNGTNDR